MVAPSETMIVLIPCFNEENNIRETVETVRAVATTLPIHVEIMMIDDGSTDGTKRELEKLCDEYGCKAIYNPKNLGVGRSLLNAYETIEDGTWVTIMPGDNEIDFGSIRKFVELRDEYDVIYGYLQNPIIRPFGRRLISFGYTRLVKTLYGFSVRYLNGMKLFNIDVFKGIEVHASGHAFNSELLAKAMLRNPALRIGELPFIAHGRATGESKAIRPRAIFQAMREVGRGLQLVGDYRKKTIEGQDD